MTPEIAALTEQLGALLSVLPRTPKYEGFSETIAESVARDACRMLLDAVDADGLGGCRLCQS